MAEIVSHQDNDESIRTERAQVKIAPMLERYGLLVVWAIIIVFFGILRPDTFLTSTNFSSMLGSQAVLAVLSLGILVPLTAGEYDLSCAGVLSVSSMTVAVLNVQHSWPIGFAILAALAVSVLIGLVNGFFVVVFGVNSFIVTLGTGTVLQGIVVWMSNSQSISGISNSLVEATFGARFLQVPLAFYYALILCFVVWFTFEYTALGRRLLFVGRSRTVSALSGLNVRRIRWGALAFSGLISGFAGVIYAGTSGSVDPTSGSSFLLPAFAAAFLGAAAIAPGRFNPWGTFIAVYFLVTGITGLTLLGAESYVQQLFYGGALVFAVAISQYSRRDEVNEVF